MREEFASIISMFLLGILLVAVSPFPLLFGMWYLTVLLFLLGVYVSLTAYKRGKDLQELYGKPRS
ncbi:hypothetical protein Ferp_2263 [Ferroglobus placidus DSM 10642]|uniref:Uncharacterized protein n=1 Tax=Ferroglobus placidus (strain DSM 10642 / AEDII12DO) TaxID=589924 RepID=D3S1C3_FERPA|nr:hypothetical protein Ferp_2263 [Ferroglobus placidus DSM 10642]